MSLSLVAVFIPILLMGGIVGRLFREFAMTLSLAILVSMVISLTTTPMMCALFLRVDHRPAAEREDRALDRVTRWYAAPCAPRCAFPALVMLVLLGDGRAERRALYRDSERLFPEQDTGRMMGSHAGRPKRLVPGDGKRTDDHWSASCSTIGRSPPLSASPARHGGGPGGGSNSGQVFIQLKPRSDRDGIDGSISRLRRALSVVPGARLFLIPVQDFRVGGRSSNAAYQYSLQADSTAELYEWVPKLVSALEKDPVLRDVSSDQQQKGWKPIW